MPEKVTAEILPGNGLLNPEVREKTPASFEANHARRQIHKGFKKLTQERRVVSRFTTGIRPAAQATPGRFPR